MRGIRENSLEHNFAPPVVFGSARRLPTENNNSNGNKDVISLRDLSMPEIWKLARDRVRISGIERRSIDNPSHKRIAVSETVTRRRTSTHQIMSRRVDSTAANDGIDDNEEFFANLLKKMTKEQFIQSSEVNKSRKRLSLWNKENAKTSDQSKRTKSNVNMIPPIPPTMAPLKKRLLPQQHNICLQAVAAIPVRSRSTKTEQRDQSVPQHKSTLNLTQEDTNMKESYLSFTDCDILSNVPRKVKENCLRQRTEDNGFSSSFLETLNLQHNHAVEAVNHNSRHATLQGDYSYSKKYNQNFLNSPCLSTIEEYLEPSMVIEPSIYDPNAMEYERHSNLSIPFTPPLPTEFVSCNAHEFDEGFNNLDENDNSRSLSALTITCPSLISNCESKYNYEIMNPKTFNIRDDNLFN
ncbi:uncharacterized protein LOC124411541 [Diprion similis]|uniref:uncharacterized protein LOC124411541 n=1 Tax=Diprion similis TaxID=362088 RepID=UPI001EF92364|nr:uncharacterized protein LOC124411541 [Diprion similis]